MPAEFGRCKTWCFVRERLLLLVETLHLLQVLEQLASLHELHNEIYSGWGVETVFQAHQKWMANFLENILLSLDLLDLVLFDYVTFVHDLDGIETSIVFFLCQNDFSKGATTQNANNFEVVFGQLFSVSGNDSDGIFGLLNFLEVAFVVVVLELLSHHYLLRRVPYHRFAGREGVGLHVLGFAKFGELDLHDHPELHRCRGDQVSHLQQVVDELVSSGCQQRLRVRRPKAVVVRRGHVQVQLVRDLRIRDGHDVDEVDLTLELVACEERHHRVEELLVSEVYEALVCQCESSHLAFLPLVDLRQLSRPNYVFCC